MELVPDAINLAVAQVVFLCEQCNKVSEALNRCTHCEDTLMAEMTLELPDHQDQVLIEIQLAADISEVYEAEIDEEKAQKKARKRPRREINSHGMYLVEQKEIYKKNSQKLDMEVVLKNWENMSNLDKAKYEEQSVKDREAKKREFEEEHGKSGIKERKMSDDEVVEQELKKKIKNKKDLETKANKREEIKDLEKDVCCSKNILKSMIEAKKQTLEVLDQEIERNSKELDNTSKEVIVAEKLILKKKETLVLVKKEYKELFSSIMSKK
eukprot:GFUD01018540.1.p1 GENE.GFUD01018540.1~~GFUD01018540.1.p1  ORF type:complete len:268 (+),score=80.82 GFUD01018540.1:122-925(+)